jgi:hypothetical protein
LPTSNVTPSTDVSTTGWANNGSGSFAATLAANSGAGDGTHLVKVSTGGTNAVSIYQTTFDTTSISSITSAAFTVAWKSDGKASTADFSIELWNVLQTIKLAHMASQATTSSGSEITTGPTNFTIDDSTVADWQHFRIKLFSEESSGTTGDFYGLVITPTYVTAVPIYSESGVTGGAVQTSGLIGLTPAFVVGTATIGSHNF